MAFDWPQGKYSKKNHLIIKRKIIETSWIMIIFKQIILLTLFFNSKKWQLFAIISEIIILLLWIDIWKMLILLFVKIIFKKIAKKIWNIIFYIIVASKIWKPANPSLRVPDHCHFWTNFSPEKIYFVCLSFDFFNRDLDSAFCVFCSLHQIQLLVRFSAKQLVRVACQSKLTSSLVSRSLRPSWSPRASSSMSTISWKTLWLSSLCSFSSNRQLELLKLIPSYADLFFILVTIFCFKNMIKIFKNVFKKTEAQRNSNDGMEVMLLELSNNS